MDAFVPHWQLFAFLLGIFAWFVRLEMRVKHLEDAVGRAFADIRDVNTKLGTLTSETVHELTKLRESMARIEGMLQGFKRAE